MTKTYNPQPEEILLEEKSSNVNHAEHSLLY